MFEGLFQPAHLVVGVIFLMIVLATTVPSYCRKHYPGRLWLGIIFCLVWGPFGQFYLPGGVKFFLLASVVGFILVKWIGFGYFWADLVSVAIIYWRYHKLGEKPWKALEQHWK